LSLRQLAKCWETAEMILHYAIAVEAKDFPASQSFVGGINRECIIVKQA